MRRTLRPLAALGATALLATLVACKGSDLLGPARNAGLSSCPAGSAILTDSPLPLPEITGWVPLGNLNPPAHTFPTDHQYLYYSNPSAPGLPRVLPVRAPAAVTITRARRVTYSTDGHSDYSLEFTPCAEVYGEFGHVATVRADILAALGTFDQQCSSYSPNPGLTVNDCYTRVGAVKAAGGDSIGTVGGVSGSYGLDLSFWDSRVPSIAYANPSRWYTNSNGFDLFHVVPASDYYAEPARSLVAAKVGSFDGSRRRASPPPGGTIAVDIAGSAQGAWLNATYPTYPEQWHLTIAPDNVDTGLIDISVGISQPTFPSGVWQIVPASSGQVSRHPAQITADGTVHCYNLTHGPTAIALLQLVDATTLKFEGRTGGSCTQPFVFSANAVTFRR